MDSSTKDLEHQIIALKASHNEYNTWVKYNGEKYYARKELGMHIPIVPGLSIHSYVGQPPVSPISKIYYFLKDDGSDDLKGQKSMTTMKSMHKFQTGVQEKSQPRRILVVGDVHGQVQALKNALALAKFEPEKGDHLIMLGDLIDRGYSSKETLDLAMELVSQGNTLVVRGNHEQMAIDAYASGNFIHWFTNGGNVAHEQIQGEKKYLDFMESMPFMHVHGSFVFVHAGINPISSIANQLTEDLLWIREPFIFDDGSMNNEFNFVVGHTPVQFINDKATTPIRHRNKLFIDTGAARGSGGKVTVYDIDSRKYWQASCVA